MKKRDEKQNQWVKNVQMGLWVALILVQMVVVSSLTVRAEVAAATEPVVEAESVVEAEVVAEAEPTAATESARLRQVEKEVVYEQVEDAAGLPDTIDLSVREAGETVTVSCQAKTRKILRERWKDDFSFPITVHAYDADYYLVGDRLIPQKEGHPELEGCKELLLELIGVSPEAYRITEILWQGAPYEDENGSLCRDALARGDRLVRDYQILYAGTARLPGEGVRRAPEPARPEERPSDAAEATGAAGELPVTQQPEAVEVLPEEASEQPLSLWQNITRTLLVAIGIGVLLFFGGLLVLAFLRLVKTFRTWYTGRKRNNRRKQDVHRK